MASSALSNYAHAPATAELVLLNGRQSGARRALGVPVTFVGRAQGCDVRLNVEEIEPFHCVLACGPDGVTVHDLNSGRGTFVNGQRLRAAVLRDGDLLDIGPFRFRVLIAPAPSAEASVAEPAAGERDALRIQAAAVAAQQAALDEVEARLDTQRQDIEQRAAQLTAEVEKQRQELREQAERLQAEHAAWKNEQAHSNNLINELARGWQEVESTRARLRAEEGSLAERAARLEQTRLQLHQQQGRLAIQQVQFNTQRELDSRMIRDGFDALARDQQRWRERRRRASAALRVRALQLVAGEHKLAQARRLIQQQKTEWETQQRVLESELHGLNNRIVHQRRKLEEQGQELRVAHVRPVEPEVPPNAAAEAARVAELDRLASELADQRAHLVEQWERLARVQIDWQQQRDEAADALEAMAERLARQEEKLDQRERGVHTLELRIRPAQEQLDRVRREAAGAHARVLAQQQTWEAEREHALGESRRLVELARRQLDAMSELRQKWNHQRAQETESLRADRQAVEAMRKELTRARLDLALHFEHALAEGHPPPETASTLEAQAADGLAMLRQLRAELQKDVEAIARRHGELAEKAEQIAGMQAKLQEQQTALEHRETMLAVSQAEMEQGLRQSESRRQFTERRLAVLQEESEHFARALLPEEESAAGALERAA